MARFPLGGVERNYDSKKARSSVVNLIPEANKDGTYRAVRRTEGLTSFSDLPDGPCRSNPLVNSGLVYVVAGTSLISIDTNGTATNRGTVGGTGRAIIKANSVPGNNQLLILNGSGDGYIYTASGGLSQITDPDFFNSTSVTILNERFWLSRDETNEFFGSDLSDGSSYDALTFGSADESPDNVESVIAKKSALWVLNKGSSEYWQTLDDATFPLRRVKGGTKVRGIAVKATLADVGDYFAFLANDRTVRLAQGTQITTISDLEFELRVKGNGTAQFPGFTAIDDAYAFFIDGPVHKLYVITFPTEKYTWCYDIKTGLPHRRESEGVDYWRVNGSVLFNNKIIVSDQISSKLWELDPSVFKEGTETQRTIIHTPPFSNDRDVTIPLIEIEMEVGKTLDPNEDPQLLVYYTKDGGNTYINKGSVSLGQIGQSKTKVRLRQFGRLPKHQDFALRLETTAAIPLQYYEAHFYPEVSF